MPRYAKGDSASSQIDDPEFRLREAQARIDKMRQEQILRELLGDDPEEVIKKDYEGQRDKEDKGEKEGLRKSQAASPPALDLKALRKKQAVKDCELFDSYRFSELPLPTFIKLAGE